MEISTLPDHGLLQACRDGDVRAWRMIVDRNEALIYSIALNHGLSDEAAGDVAVKVFEELEASLDVLEPGLDLRRWLAHTARRKALWHPSRSPGLIQGDRDEPITSYERVEFVESLHRAFARLDPRCTRLLALMYFDSERRSYADLAQELDVPKARIGLMRARCLKCLRRALSEDPDSPLRVDAARLGAGDVDEEDPTALETSGSGGAIPWSVR